MTKQQFKLNKTKMPQMFWFSLLLLSIAFMGCNAGDPYVPSSKGTMAIVNVSPIENASNVPINSSVSVTFEKGIDIRTLNRATIKLSSITGTTIPGNISYNSATRVATYTPVVNMKEGTHYEFTVSEVKGADEEYIPPYVFRFITAEEFLVTRINPRDEFNSVIVTGVGKQEIFAIFNQSIDVAKVSTANFYAIEQSNSDLDFEEIMPATLIYDDTLKQLSIKPERGRLKFSTEYFVTLRDIQSVNNGMIGSVNWTFNTEEIRVNATQPSSDAMNISTGTDISIFFQAAVDKTSVAGNIKLKEAFGVQKEFFFMGEPEYDLDDTKITFRTKVSSSDIGLKSNTRYEIQIDGVFTAEGERFQNFRSFFTTE